MTDVIDIKTRRILRGGVRGVSGETPTDDGVERVVFELEEDVDRSVAIAPDGGMLVILLDSDPVHGGTPAALAMNTETATELGVALIEAAHTARRIVAAREASKKPPKG